MDIGIAQRPMRGETVCGDAVTVVDHSLGTLVVLADGLGHGPEAAEAAQTLCAFAEKHAEDSLAQMLNEATKAIAHTRGAVAAFLRIDEGGRRLSFAGIGNIEMQAVSEAAIRPICIPGILGRPLRKVMVFEYALSKGDLLLLHTDGISSRFALADFATRGAKQIADAVMNAHGKNHDDATCVVICV